MKAKSRQGKPFTKGNFDGSCVSTIKETGKEGNSMLKVGDTVKVISKTRTFLGMQEFIPIGTICTVVKTCVERDGSLYYGVKNNDETFYYLESELEKGNLVWVPEKEEEK